MNPTLLKIAQFLAKRPHDTTIRIMHIATGVLILLLLWWAQDRSVIDIPFIGVKNPETEQKIEYGLMIVALFFLGRGIITACIMKHSWLRWKQALHGVALVIIGGPMMDPIRTVFQPTQNTEGFVVNNIEEIVSWHPGIFLILLGLIWIFIGLTGKGTTEKCLRYGEVVKKIRV